MILDEIVDAKREEIAQHRRVRPLEMLRDSRGYPKERRAFRDALERDGRAIIAEVKKASPSRGVLREEFDPPAIAKAYEEAGARAVSVLTDAPYFQGSLSFLEVIRDVVSLPLLRKDFLIDPYQIAEARAFGADAVLLIAAITEGGLLEELLGTTREIGLEALVEVHSGRELDRALGAGASIVGINNRDLRTFLTDLEVAEELAPQVPEGVLSVAESGLRSCEDLERLEAASVRAFLIGETFMVADDPGRKLRELLE